MKYLNLVVITFLAFATTFSAQAQGLFDCELISKVGSGMFGFAMNDSTLMNVTVVVNSWEDCASQSIASARGMDDYLQFVDSKKHLKSYPTYVTWALTADYAPGGGTDFNFYSGSVTKYTSNIAEGDQRLWKNLIPWK